jgi:hypothetical protein
MRVLAQESRKMELGIERYGSGRFQGQNGLFRMFWGAFVHFFSGWKSLRERTRALAKFDNFSGNFGGFLDYLERLGPNHNYFLEIEGPAAISSNMRDRGKIYKKNKGFDAKFTGYNESGIVFQ